MKAGQGCLSKDVTFKLRPKDGILGTCFLREGNRLDKAKTLSL